MLNDTTDVSSSVEFGSKGDKQFISIKGFACAFYAGIGRGFARQDEQDYPQSGPIHAELIRVNRS